MEHITADSHGFSGDGIPQVKDTIRIDLVGGFVLQKVESNKCYFRAIFNFDIKLEFIPASLINFISRQLIGNGHKLYQKAVGSVATVDEDYRLALQGPLYVRIRQHLQMGRRPATSLEGLEKEKLTAFLLEECKDDAPAKDNAIKTRTSVPEITEENTEQREEADGINHMAKGSSKGEASISPEVEHALDILDQAISVVRGQSIAGKNCCKPSSIGDDFPISELVAKASLLSYRDVPESSNNKLKIYASDDSPQRDDHRQNNMSSCVIEAGHNLMALSPLEERFSDLDDSNTTETKFNFHVNLPSKPSVAMMQLSTLDSTCKVCDEESLKANGYYSSGVSSSSGNKIKTKKTRKKLSLCCLGLGFIRD